MYLKNKPAIFILFFCFTILFTTSVFSKTNLSKYWSLEKKTPYSIEIVKKKFLNSKKLRAIEGIWSQEGRLVEISFNENQKWWGFRYSKFILKDDVNPKNIGIKEATIHRTKYEDYFIIFEKSDNKIKNNFNTNFGTINLISENEANVKIYGKKKKLLKQYSLKKIFP